MGTTRIATIHVYDKCKDCAYRGLNGNYGECCHKDAEKTNILLPTLERVSNQMCYWKRAVKGKDLTCPKNCPLKASKPTHDVHALKILPRWYNDVESGKKNFEIRRRDCDFKVGDTLLLKEYERGSFTGRKITKEIEYIYIGDGTYGLSSDFCILGLK